MKTTQQEQYIRCLKSLKKGDCVLVNLGTFSREFIVGRVDMQSDSILVWVLGHEDCGCWLPLIPRDQDNRALVIRKSQKPC